MRRDIAWTAILFALLVIVYFGGEPLLAEGGHSPGITMESDQIMLMVPCDTTLDFRWFDISDPSIDEAIDLLLSTSYESLGYSVPDTELVLFLQEIYEVHDNPLGYPLTDMELIYEFFAGGENFPEFYLEDSYGNPYPMAERNHVDVYMNLPGVDEMPYNSMQPSAFSDPDEDPDTTACKFHDNSLLTNGPKISEIGDGLWYKFSAPVFNHEFAHLCYLSQGVSAGMVGDNEMFAHFAGYLGGSPYKRPRFNPDYDTGLIHGTDEYMSNPDRRRNIWNLWGAYLLQHFMWPDTSDMTDDLVYRWTHTPEIESDGSKSRSFYALAESVLSRSEYLDSLDVADGHEALTKTIKNWTIANWLDNPNFDDGWYGYGRGFSPSVDIGIFAHNDFGAPDTIRAWSIPPDFMMDAAFDNVDSLFTGTWTDPLSGGTDPIRLFPNAADYMGMRASSYYEDGRPHELRFIFDGNEQTFPDNTELFLTAITYSSASDSLYLMGGAVISVDALDFDSETLRGELVVPGFGDSVKGAAMVISLVETYFPPERNYVDSDFFYYSYWVGATSAKLMSPDQSGIVWIPGHDKEISWECPQSDGDLVRILLSTDGGETYPDTLADGLQNSGSYVWTVGDYDSDTCRIKVEVEREYGYVLWDESSYDFEICDGVEVFLETDPPGGELWIDGVVRDSSGVCGGTGTESVEIDVTSPQAYDGLEHSFLSWSDGGAKSHDVYPTSDTTFIASMDPGPKPHDGWPMSALNSFVTPPVLADVNGDGVEDLILLSGDEYSSDRLFVLEEDGDNLSGFPVGVAGTAGLMGVPAAGDIDGDGKAEIVWAGDSLTVYDDDGDILWWKQVTGTKAGAPLVVDCDYDGRAEVFYSTTEQVFAWDSLGVSLPDWPVSRTVDVENLGMGAVLAAADVDMDGIREIISLPDVWHPDTSKVWAGQIDSKEYGPVAIGDLDGDGYLEIVACDADGDSCYAWDVTGESPAILAGWPVNAYGGVLPSLADLDDDGALEVIMGGPTNVPVCSSTGAEIGNLSTYSSGAQNEVMAGDMYDTNGGAPEIVTQREVSVESGAPTEVVVINDVSTGSVEYGWPSDELCSSCGLIPTALGDIDGDGLMEIVSAGDSCCVWDCDHDPAAAPSRAWSQFRQGPGHTGAVGSAGTITTTVIEPWPVYCPLGDAGYLKVNVELRDDAGDPIEGVPVEAIFAVATYDTSGTAVLCLGDTIFAGSPTDCDGKTALITKRIGGCGVIELTLHALGAARSLGEFSIKSPDLTGDCAVDLPDFGVFTSKFGSHDPCVDYNFNNDWDAYDFAIFAEHYSGNHLSIHPGHSSAELTPSDEECLVLCPKGDLESFVIDVAARNAHDLTFTSSNISADSIWAMIPPPGSTGPNAKFRFLCRPNNRKAIADGPTDNNEETTISVNSGGGHTQQLEITTEICEMEVGSWSGAIKSPDINASGRVDYTDLLIFSLDDQSGYDFRSDMNCDGDLDDDDLLIINAHYGHRCGASSQALAEEGPDPRPWADGTSDALRAVVPNAALDRWLSYELHQEVRALLEYVRSLPEPEEFGGREVEISGATISLLPQVTALAQSYPNPFRGVAMIKYQVAPPGGHVRVLIFDAAGRLVRTLVDEDTPPGFYDVSWDGRNDDGRMVAAGVYFYQMKTPGFVSNKRMMLVR